MLRKTTSVFACTTMVPVLAVFSTKTFSVLHSVSSSLGEVLLVPSILDLVRSTGWGIQPLVGSISQLSLAWSGPSHLLFQPSSREVHSCRSDLKVTPSVHSTCRFAQRSIDVGTVSTDHHHGFSSSSDHLDGGTSPCLLVSVGAAVGSHSRFSLIS